MDGHGRPGWFRPRARGGEADFVSRNPGNKCVTIGFSTLLESCSISLQQHKQKEIYDDHIAAQPHETISPDATGGAAILDPMGPHRSQRDFSPYRRDRSARPERKPFPQPKSFTEREPFTGPSAGL